jgi:dTDP-glucose 4,6-dehydratase
MKALITGDKGFIGSHLRRELSDHGYSIEGHDKADGDLTHPGVFSAHLDAAEPDLVIHLAAQVGRLFGEQDLAHTIESNVTMTALVAKACGERGVPVLYASSSEVYGDQGEECCWEEGPVKLPHNAYGLSKWQGEEFCRLDAPEGWKVVRLSMPYGPGAPPGIGRRALDTFLWQAVHGKAITVHEGAERSWCWIGDTVAGIRAVIEDGYQGVWNIGRDDCPISMLDLAGSCCALAGASPDLIEVVPAPERQTVVKRLSTTKLQLLGWEPTVELEEGLPQVLEWVRRFDAEGRGPFPQVFAEGGSGRLHRVPVVEP